MVFLFDLLIDSARSNHRTHVTTTPSRGFPNLSRAWALGESDQGTATSRYAFASDEGFYERVFEQSLDAMAVLDDEGHILRLNRAAREFALGDLSTWLASQAEPAQFLRQLRSLQHARADMPFTGEDARVYDLRLQGWADGPRHVVVVRDVTDRRRLESEIAKLAQQESVGPLAASVVHDLSNLLTVVSASNGALAAEVEASPHLRELAEEVRGASTRAIALTRQLLRCRPSPPTPVDIDDALGDLRAIIERLVGTRVEVSWRLGQAVGSATLDHGAFERAVLNLVLNAREAMPEGGRLTISTRRVTTDLHAHTDASSSLRSLIAVIVSDTGVGMAPEVKERIFDWFFTTKAPGLGTGLGLPMVRRFANHAGGRVIAHSTPGLGTTMVLYLPSVEAPQAGASSD